MHRKCTETRRHRNMHRKCTESGSFKIYALEAHGIRTSQDQCVKSEASKNKSDAKKRPQKGASQAAKPVIIYYTGGKKHVPTYIS